MSSTPDTPVDSVSDGLLVIEIELRRLEYWESSAPTSRALQSQQPFCVDTLIFTQWLQFIFLPKMKTLVEQDQPLPTVSGIAPMAEEFFRREPVAGDSLIDALRQIDTLLGA